jgi:hypothetical protein
MIMGEQNQTNLNHDQGKRFALLVGVNRYADPRQFSTLEGCVNDVQRLESTLNRLSYCDVVCLHDNAGEGLEATKDNIEFQLETLAKLMADADGESRIANNGFEEMDVQYRSEEINFISGCLP